MAARKVQSIGEVVGRNLAAWRAERGVGQEEVAAMLRGVGLRWTRDVVTNLERGRTHDMTVGELVAMATALGRPADYWLAGAGRVAITPYVAVALDDLRRALAAGSDDMPFPVDDHLSPRWHQEGDVAYAPAIESMEWIEELPEPISRAERHAGHTLGVSPVVIRKTAGQLWGRPLTAEREARLGGATGPGPRSAVTRALLGELRTALEEEGTDGQAR